jgi:hypothetical protein
MAVADGADQARSAPLGGYGLRPDARLPVGNDALNGY